MDALIAGAASAPAIPFAPARTKVRVLLHFDPAVVNWFELRQSFQFSSWEMYHHARVNGRQPDLVAAVGHVPSAELRAYHSLPRERLGRLPCWIGDPNGCPFPETTGAVCEDTSFAADEETTSAFLRPSHACSSAAAASAGASAQLRAAATPVAPYTLGPELFVDDAHLPQMLREIVAAEALADAYGSGVGATGGCCTPSSAHPHQQQQVASSRRPEPFRASSSSAQVKCRTGGHVVCKLLHLRDAFGWGIVDLEHAEDTAPAPLPDLHVPVARHAHFLLGAAYRESHDSARKRSLQFMWEEVIPVHHHLLFIVESTSEESHRLHVHVPNASFISGDWESELDGYLCGEPNVVAAARREVHEETGILIDGCDMWMMDWAGVRTVVECGGTFTRLQEVLCVVNLNGLAAVQQQRTTPLYMLHPRVVPSVFNDFAPMVPQWHVCSCRVEAFLQLCYREGAVTTEGHTTATSLRLCVLVHTHDAVRNVCVRGDEEAVDADGGATPADTEPSAHFDVLFSSIETRRRVLQQIDETDSSFVFSWSHADAPSP